MQGKLFLKQEVSIYNISYERCVEVSIYNISYERCVARVHNKSNVYVHVHNSGWSRICTWCSKGGMTMKRYVINMVEL